MTSRSFPLFTSLLLASVIACGGSQPQPTPTPLPASPTEPPATAVPTKPGPTQTPAGIVFNFKPDRKPAKIFLAGNFNNWNPSDPKFLLRYDGPSDIWSITVKLVPGTYQYKFVADGQWTKDPFAPGSAPDGYGGQNGQFDVK
jgi:hypothetical protein